ncbi:MAG: hypothetical protein NZ534_00080 [Bacteroidia bacterium]|nr:hypothetical protein [Bacteroidia bacterium]
MIGGLTAQPEAETLGSDKVRRRYVWSEKERRLVEVSPFERAEQLAFEVMRDIEPYVSPVDGSYIDTRKKHNAHMKRYGLVRYDDFSQEELERRVKERVKRMQGLDEQSRRERIQALSDAYEYHRDQLRAKYGR